MSYDKVDWSVAPADATHWEMTEFGKAIWSREQWIHDGPNRLIPGSSSCAGDMDFAPDFGFSGDHLESLTSRPGYTGLEQK